MINPVDPQLLVEIFEVCCKHHRRGQLGYLPSRHSKLCNYREGVSCLHDIVCNVTDVLTHSGRKFGILSTLLHSLW